MATGIRKAREGEWFIRKIRDRPTLCTKRDGKIGQVVSIDLFIEIDRAANKLSPAVSIDGRFVGLMSGRHLYTVWPIRKDQTVTTTSNVLGFRLKLIPPSTKKPRR